MTTRGIMLATAGYANYPGRPCVERGDVVVVTEATNLPNDRPGLDYFVARVDDPDYSIAVGADEFVFINESEGCDD